MNNGWTMIGRRLRRTRRARGLSLRQLEAAMGGVVSAQAIGKYERDEMMPGSKALRALAKALRVAPEFLLRYETVVLDGMEFRKLPQTSAKEARTLEAKVLDHIERYLELENLFPNSSIGWAAPRGVAYTIESVEGAESAAEALRRHWALGIDAIADMTELLEVKGVKVIAFELPDRVSGSKACVRGTAGEVIPVIVVNRRHNGERQRFTLAHELAHLVLRLSILDEAAREKAADRFAGAFLVPRKAILCALGAHRDVVSLGELADLKALFEVSMASLVVRCFQVGVLSRSAYRRLWAQVSELGWNSPGSPEPNPLAPETPRRMERIALRGVAEGAISRARAAELLRTSVRDVERRAMGLQPLR